MTQEHVRTYSATEAEPNLNGRGRRHGDAGVRPRKRLSGELAAMVAAEESQVGPCWIESGRLDVFRARTLWSLTRLECYGLTFAERIEPLAR